jgi:hypothetical protein
VDRAHVLLVFTPCWSANVPCAVMHPEGMDMCREIRCYTVSICVKLEIADYSDLSSYRTSWICNLSLIKMSILARCSGSCL